MKINYIDQNPREIRLEEDLPPYMNEGVADDIAEIFNTPLSGAYNWDYTVQDNRIKKLYELGKELNWNVELDIDWNRPLNIITEPAPIFWDEYEPYKKLSDKKKVEFLNHRIAWSQSQFLHRELKEETNITKVELIKELDGFTTYELPDHLSEELLPTTRNP